MMLKRLLMFWLIISTLGYGSVWAFDGHAYELNEHQRVAGDVGHSPDGDGDHHSCDHCCHASAHTMALSPFQPDTTYSGNCAGNTPYLQTALFSISSPP